MHERGRRERGPAPAERAERAGQGAATHEKALGSGDAANENVRYEARCDVFHPAAHRRASGHDGGAHKEWYQAQVTRNKECEQRELDRLAPCEGRVALEARHAADERCDQVVEGDERDGDGQPQALLCAHVLRKLSRLLEREALHAV